MASTLKCKDPSPSVRHPSSHQAQPYIHDRARNCSNSAVWHDEAELKSTVHGRHDDGKLAVFKGHDPAHSTGMLRGMRPRYRSGHT
jgi:hypothetical protein|eukprot:SAG25_NODE_107_length_15283_cov_3.516728_9_plen_86_part_00